MHKLYCFISVSAKLLCAQFDHHASNFVALHVPLLSCERLHEFSGKAIENFTLL